VANYYADDLVPFGAALLTATGVPPDEARQVARSLVRSNLRGHDSHGVMRIPSYVAQVRKGELIAGAPLTTLTETPAVLFTDAGRGFGQVQARRLIERVIEKARRVGVACGTAKNCGHVGRLGEYTEQAAEAGLAAFGTVNDNGVLRSVAPPGGVEPCISTNPLSFAVPTGGCPLVLDASTSAVAQGKVTVKRLAAEPCPQGWLQDAEGNPTTDPNVALDDPPGTLLPLGGPMSYKGFGLGMLMDVLAGGLSGGFCPPPPSDAPECNSVLFVVWAPEFFAGPEHLKRQADELIALVRGSRRKAGVEAIRVPGDTSAATEAERRRAGIPLPADNWQKLADLADELGVEKPKAVR
jgi:uncharacterized oxidoreductase